MRVKVTNPKKKKIHSKKPGYDFSILPGPFIFDADHEPEFLPVVNDDGSVNQNPGAMNSEKAVLVHDGLHFVNSNLFTPDKKTREEMNGDFKNLVNSVIAKV